jgi:hypothetical protein
MTKRSTLKFWAVFLAFLFPGVDDLPEPGDEPADEPQDEPADAPTDELDLSENEPEPSPRSNTGNSEAEIAALRATTETQARLLANFMAGGGRSNAPVQDENERVLNDPNATPEDRWRAQANRALGQGHSAGQRALAVALDAQDASSFQLRCVTDKLAAKYAKLVESKRQELIAKNGQAPKREAILTFVLGEEIQKRQEKSAGTKPKKAASNSSVDRGRTPNARSDVGRSGKSESQKRRERLENVQI